MNIVTVQNHWTKIMFAIRIAACVILMSWIFHGIQYLLSPTEVEELYKFGTFVGINVMILGLLNIVGCFNRE